MLNALPEDFEDFRLHIKIWRRCDPFEKAKLFLWELGIGSPPAGPPAPPGDSEQAGLGLRRQLRAGLAKPWNSLGKRSRAVSWEHQFWKKRLHSNCWHYRHAETEKAISRGLDVGLGVVDVMFWLSVWLLFCGWDERVGRRTTGIQSERDGTKVCPEMSEIMTFLDIASAEKIAKISFLTWTM